MESGWRKTKGAEIISHWPRQFTNFSTSPAEFYRSVEENIARHEVPSLDLSRTTWKEGSFLSADREYLRVTRRKYICDVCAAPFGKDFFFSYWLVMLPPAFTIFNYIGMATTLFCFFSFLTPYIGYTKGGLCLVALIAIIWGIFRSGALRDQFEVEEYLLGLTIIGAIWNVYRHKLTYFEIDTALMFQTVVHGSVLESIDALTDGKGLPRMGDSDRKPINRDFFKP